MKIRIITLAVLVFAICGLTAVAQNKTPKMSQAPDGKILYENVEPVKAQPPQEAKPQPASQAPATTPAPKPSSGLTIAEINRRKAAETQAAAQTPAHTSEVVSTTQVHDQISALQSDHQSAVPNANEVPPIKEEMTKNWDGADVLIAKPGLMTISIKALPSSRVVNDPPKPQVSPRQAFETAMLPGFEFAGEFLFGISNYTNLGFVPRQRDFYIRGRKEFDKLIVRGGFRYTPNGRKWFVEPNEGTSQGSDLEAELLVAKHIAVGGQVNVSSYKNPSWTKKGVLVGPAVRFPFVNRAKNILAEPGISYTWMVHETVNGIQPHNDEGHRALKIDCETLFKVSVRAAVALKLGFTNSWFRQNGINHTGWGTYVGIGFAFGAGK